MRHAISSRLVRARGFNLLEVLVSMLIVVIGLLGLAGLQARAQIGEFEAYQRAQALVLLYDMVDRINNNRLAASCFRITTDTTDGAPYFGTGSTVTPACAVDTAANNAMADAAMTGWNNLLLGSSETKAGASVGAMIGARGCVSYNTATEYQTTSGAGVAGTGEYTVAVSWQGMANTFTPVAVCGKGLYGNEASRRTVWATMRIGTLKAQ